MNETTQQTSAVATGAFVWRALGVLIGTATVISLVKSGFAIELHGIPAKVYQQYAWLRDILFEPVVWVLGYFGLAIPWWLKDMTMAYGLVAFAHWRATSEVPRMRIGGAPSSRGFKRGGRTAPVIRVVNAIGWPIVQVLLVARLRRYLREYSATEMRSVIYVYGMQRKFRRLVLLHLLAVIFFAATFFLWNHLQNAMGPAS